MDSIGALQLPATDEQGVGGDPLLEAFGAFLGSYINSVLTAEWARVAPGSGLPVKHVITASVERAIFDDGRLPALFVYRQEDDSERIADELFQVTTRLHAVWVPPLSDTGLRERRAPMGNAVAKAIKHVLRLGRHPKWVALGDTDPSAAELGSVLMDRAGLSEEPRALKTMFDPNVKVKVEGVAPIEFDATLVIIQCVELSEFDPALRGVPEAMTTTVTQGGGAFSVQVRND